MDSVLHDLLTADGDSVTDAKPLYIIIGVVALSGLAAIYFAFDPAGSIFFPKCPFLTMTGWKCPGCGSQRAIHALLHGDLSTAWEMNALLLAELPLMALLAAAWMLRHRYPRLRAVFGSRPFILSVTSIIVFWTIVRNIVHI